MDIQALVAANSSTRFAVNCHSNVGFLQADSNGVRLVREAMEIEAGDAQFPSRGKQPEILQVDSIGLYAPLHLSSEPVLSRQ